MLKDQDALLEKRRSQRIRADKILKKNSLQGMCISCHEPIFGDEAMLSTIHGQYHDTPKTCVDGRD